MQTQANITQSLRSHYYTQAAGPGASCVGALLQYRCCLLTSKLRRPWERRQGKVYGLWVHVSKAVLLNQEETKRRFRFPWLCLLEWGFYSIEPGVCDQFYKLPIEMSRPFVETTKRHIFKSWERWRRPLSPTSERWYGARQKLKAASPGVHSYGYLEELRATGF